MLFAFQTVEYPGCGFRFAAAATPLDIATRTVDYGLATLLIFFQKSRSPSRMTSLAEAFIQGR